MRAWVDFAREAGQEARLPQNSLLVAELHFPISLLFMQQVTGDISACTLKGISMQLNQNVPQHPRDLLESLFYV